jgi:O-antigen ligase
VQRLAPWALAVATVLVLGSFATLGLVAALILAGILLVADLWGLRVVRHRHVRTGPLGAIPGALAASWLVVTLFPAHNFAYRPNSEAVSSVGIQPLIELMLFSGVAAFSLHVIRRLEPTLARARPPLTMFLLPAWVVASSLWSATGPYAFVRGTQMVAIALLGWATVAAGRHSEAASTSALRAFVWGFVLLTLGLIVLGLALGPLYVPTSEENLSRFTWIGAHPNGSGLIMAVAVVLVLTSPRSLLGWPGWVRGSATTALLVAMYANHSRTAWACLVVALGTAAAINSRRRPWFRTIGLPLLGTALVGAIYFRGGDIWDYVLRDRDSESLTTGNGRLQLWGIGFDALHSVFDWVAGLGYGAARTVFIAEVPWAVTAHNSVLSLLVSVGLIGVLALLALVVTTVRELRVTGASDPATLLATCLLVLVIANGAATDALAEPNIGFALVVLVGATARVAAEARRTSSGTGGQSPTAPSTRSQPSPAGAEASHGERSSTSMGSPLAVTSKKAASAARSERSWTRALRTSASTGNTTSRV